MTTAVRAQRGRTLGELERCSRDAGARLVGGPAERVVVDVVQDSRKVTPGALFVARSGGSSDGRRFVADALARGAVAVLCEPGGVDVEPRLEVRNLALAWSSMAHEVHGQPSRELPVVGITGTNGKTTVACLIEQALRALGGRPARLGTLGFFIGEEKRADTLTTPQPDDLARHLREAVDGGATQMVMEVSSHALAQGRALGVRFAVAAFTNLSQDHLDFHGSLDAYAAAKRKLLVDHEPDLCVINVDDAWGARFAEELRAARGADAVLRVSARAGQAAEVHVESWRQTAAGAIDTGEGGGASSGGAAVGSSGTVSVLGAQVELRSPLLGEHNLENLLVALGCLVALGFSAPRAAAALENAPGAPGRLERCDAPGDDLVVLVDYAHTPDALRRCLEALGGLGRPVTCLFGCGGDRDRAKRPLMGEAAVRRARRVVVTSDNPRTEAPTDIIDEIRPGLAAAPSSVEVRVEPDRARAIRETILRAESGDVVLLAGKGHETHQILADRVIDFDDREHARQALHLRREQRRTGRAMSSGSSGSTGEALS